LSKCNRCGAETTTSPSFCNSCGAPLRRDCSFCGNSNPLIARYCERCGRDFTMDKAGLTVASSTAWREQFKKFGWWLRPADSDLKVVMNLFKKADVPLDADDKYEPWIFFCLVRNTDWAISSLTYQTGIDVKKVRERWILATRCRFVFLGFGKPMFGEPSEDVHSWRYEDMAQALASQQGGVAIALKDGGTIGFSIKTKGPRLVDTVVAVSHAFGPPGHEAEMMIAASNIRDAAAGQSEFMSIIQEFCWEITNVKPLQTHQAISAAKNRASLKQEGDNMHIDNDVIDGYLRTFGASKSRETLVAYGPAIFPHVLRRVVIYLHGFAESMNSDNVATLNSAQISIDKTCHQMWDLFNEILKHQPDGQRSMAAQINTALRDKERDIRILASTCAAFLKLGIDGAILQTNLKYNILQDSDLLSKISSAAALIPDLRIADSKLDFICKALIDFYVNQLVPPDITKPTEDREKERLVLSSIPYHLSLGTTLPNP
jgi:hypothetical protein